MDTKTVEPIFTEGNLFEHRSTIIRWIRSCQRLEQLELLKIFIINTFMPGYEKAVIDTKTDINKHVFKGNVEMYLVDFEYEINKRRIILNYNDKKTEP